VRNKYPITSNEHLVATPPARAPPPALAGALALDSGAATARAPAAAEVGRDLNVEGGCSPPKLPLLCLPTGAPPSTSGACAAAQQAAAARLQRGKCSGQQGSERRLGTAAVSGDAPLQALQIVQMQAASAGCHPCSSLTLPSGRTASSTNGCGGLKLEVDSTEVACVPAAAAAALAS
jgi:hypothetical protein